MVWLEIEVGTRPLDENSNGLAIVGPDSASFPRLLF